MKKGLIVIVFLMFIYPVSAFMCSEYAGQDISMDVFLNECAWYLSIPFMIIGLIGAIWPSLLSRVNYSGRVRIGGIIFLVVGLIILALQIIY